jgi:hypothetical protein
MKLQRRLLAPFLAFLARLRYRTLFLVVAGLFALDLVVPDFVPFADEILLGIATIVLARLRKPKDVIKKESTGNGDIPTHRPL